MDETQGPGEGFSGVSGCSLGCRAGSDLGRAEGLADLRARPGALLF